MPHRTTFLGRTLVSGAWRKLRPLEWPGLDRGFATRVGRVAATPRAGKFEGALARELEGVRGKRSPFCRPQLVRPEYAARLSGFVEAYHRAIMAIVAASATDARVRDVLCLPSDLQEEVEGDHDPRNGTIHFCRLDLLLDPDGGFKVLETNANCPGVIFSCGVATRRWREYLAAEGLELPASLDHERTNWMAEWFLRAAREESGHAPELVGLFREDGGNRLELPGLARQLRDEGFEAFEVDPRELRLADGGVPTVRGRAVRHAYLKLGIQRILCLRTGLQPFLEAVRTRELFVQNGLRGRFVGDNKLCLALLSDPAYADLFDPADLELLRPHIPWTRPLAGCSMKEIDRVASHPEDFVLKNPLDTQGRGILIGRGLAHRGEWSRWLGLAIRNRWLVQEFCPTTRLTVDRHARQTHNHDLCLGVVGGRLAGAAIRSSERLRTNVALTGRLHPVFMEPVTRAPDVGELPPA